MNPLNVSRLSLSFKKPRTGGSQQQQDSLDKVAAFMKLVTNPTTPIDFNSSFSEEDAIVIQVQMGSRVQRDLFYLAHRAFTLRNFLVDQKVSLPKPSLSLFFCSLFPLLPSDITATNQFVRWLASSTINNIERYHRDDYQHASRDRQPHETQQQSHERERALPTRISTIWTWNRRHRRGVHKDHRIDERRRSSSTFWVPSTCMAVTIVSHSNHIIWHLFLAAFQPEETARQSHGRQCET